MNEKLKVLDLFSGIGGFSLGLGRTGGFETVAFCEIDPFCRRILAKHWPDVPIHEDVRKLTADAIGPVDIVTGGFPCQKFCSAARGRNNAPDLWPEMARLAFEIKPHIIIAENVQFEPIAKAADHFCGMGMRCDVIRISAYEIGADTQRNRWWAVAHPYKSGKFSSSLNAETCKLPAVCAGVWGAEAYRAAIRLSDGIPRRLDELRPYGNAILPQIPEIIGNAILEAEREMRAA